MATLNPHPIASTASEPVHELKQPRVGFIRRVWREVVKASERDIYQTTYVAYLHGAGFNQLKLEKFKDGRPITDLSELEAVVRHYVEDESTEWTYGIIYEMRAVVRIGTDWKRAKRP